MTRRLAITGMLLGTLLFFQKSMMAQQSDLLNLFEVKKNVTAAKINLLSTYVNEAVLMTVNGAAAGRLLREKPASVQLEMPLEKGAVRRLALQRFQVLAPGAKTVAGGEAGDKEFPMQEHFVAYTGTVAGEKQSLVSMSVTTNGIYGLIHFHNEDYVVGSPRDNRLFEPGDYLLYPASGLKMTNDFFCATETMEIPSWIQEMMVYLQDKTQLQTKELLEVKMAIESDYETFVRFGSVEGATSYLLSLMAGVSAIYTRDLNVKLLVVYTRVWDTPDDPYSGESALDFLDQFVKYWNKNMQHVRRDLAHYITTRSGRLGGVAWVDKLCSSLSNGLGYAFSNTNGHVEWLPVYSWDADVTAHETGHNFGSPHTHDCNWIPRIDTCVVTEENELCSEEPRPRRGTIMSYCHLTHAGKTLAFHPQPVALMRKRAEQASCISAATEVLRLATPNGGEHYFMLSEVEITWGAAFTGSVDLQYSLDNGGNWRDLATNIPADRRTFTWFVPAMLTTDQALVRISDNADPTVQDASDAPFTIESRLLSFELIEPLRLTTLVVEPRSTFPIRFVWHRAGDLPGITYRLNLVLNAPAAPTVSFSADLAGRDTSATLTAGQIDSLLSSWNAWTTGDSVRVGYSTTAFLEGHSAQSATIHFIYFKRLITGLSRETRTTTVPGEFYLSQNYPNPFNPRTYIAYHLPGTSRVTLKIYTVLGEEIAELVNAHQPPGSYQAKWTGEDAQGREVPSGIYLCRLAAKPLPEGAVFVSVRKMVLLR